MHWKGSMDAIDSLGNVNANEGPLFAKNHTFLYKSILQIPTKSVPHKTVMFSHENGLGCF